MGKVISVILPKGGVGKTTSAVNLAIKFAKQNFKTLLVDLDPTASCSLSLGFTEENIFGDVFDVFSYSKTIDKVIHPTEIENLFCIPQMKLNSVEEGRQNRLIANNFLLRNIINSIRANYEFIIFDCPPYLFGTTSLALIASDSVIAPIRTDEYSLDAIKTLAKRVEYVKTLYNRNLKIDGIFLTVYERNIKAAFKIKAELYKRFPRLMMNVSIPKDVNMMNVTFSKKPLSIILPNSKASLAYKELALELIAKYNIMF
ncbi:MAG: ParA family protein [Ignavibacteriae bacterium]|nr:ParA family protein [Ignavibacteriota bacterium]